MILVAAFAAPVPAETLTGTALIQERAALPPGASFEAEIEDIARAGAPATRLARTVIGDPGQPPIDFTIDYDPTALDPRAIYSLRATIRRQGQLLFTTDTVTRVLHEERPQDVEVVLSMVTHSAEPLPAHGLRLPATFRGTLPFADFEGVRHHLDLWPDQVYHMRREWFGGVSDPLRRDEIGRWYADPHRGTIVLHGASEMPLIWKVTGSDQLQQTDLAGNAIGFSPDHRLISDGTLEPTELEDLFMLGRMTYQADAAVFEECLSGVRYPVAKEGDYLALESAYLDAAPQPAAPLVVHVEGDLVPRPAAEGAPRTSLVVDRFIAVRPDDACARPEPQASLTDTYWRIDTLTGDEVGAQPNRREPHIVLHGGADARFRATVGCNQIIGRYVADGEMLTLDETASTRMACPPPLDRLEDRLQAVLAETRAVLLDGQSLFLLDAEGNTVAELAAVYLR